MGQPQFIESKKRKILKLIFQTPSRFFEGNHSVCSRRYHIGDASKIYSFDRSRFQLENLQLHSKDIPCDVEYRPFYAAETAIGTFIPLDAVLAGIFREFKVHRSLLAVLSELSDVITLGFPFSCL